MAKNILYVSSLCSPSLLKYLYETCSFKPIQSVQKFHRLIVEGIKMSDDSITVDTLSSIPVNPRNHKKVIWNIPSEKFNNVSYNYIPFINFSVLREIIVFLYSFVKVVSWRFSNPKSSEKKVICDALKLSLTLSSILACKLTGIKIFALVTDLPGYMVLNFPNRHKFKIKVFNKLTLKMLNYYDGYIVLTEQLNNVVNTRNKPYIVMEGLVDTNMKLSSNTLESKTSEQILIYAGGLFEKYGIKKLIDAFMLVKGADLRLHIYGSGELVEKMPIYVAQDPRIVYKGNVPNQEVVNDLQKATLLINPRPSAEMLTHYSFPSKNMEYMVSGTPLLTTLLPGMPKEYNDYVYLLEDETVEGIKSKLNQLLNQSKEELHRFGLRGKEFVLQNKSNILQAGRIAKLLTN